MRLTGRPATAGDVKLFYPEMTCSFRAWTCELNGEPKGIIGLALLHSLACLFSTFDEELRPHLKSLAVLRLIKKAEGAVRESRVPVWTVAQPDEPTAPAILQRLGFAPLGEIADDMIYVFTPGESA